MTTELDDILVPEVLAIVEQFGKLVRFAVPGSQVYDPTTGLSTERPALSITKKVSPPQPYTIKLIDGENIKAGDACIWLPASGLTFTPVAGMKVTIDSAVWAIVAVDSVYTGELIALYGLQLRQ